MVQIPESSHAFDLVLGTDGPPSHSVSTVNICSHLESILICMVPFAYWWKGNQPNRLSLWRFNGAGPNDTKIPVVLAHGTWGTRFSMDNSQAWEIYSLARFLANRGRDVWVIEFEQSTYYGSQEYINYLEQGGYTWREWYWEYLTTQDKDRYNYLDTYFQEQDLCTVQTPIVMTGDIYTATFDDYIFEDTPAIIAAILYHTEQTKVQWVGHSIGGTVIFGLMPTHFESQGRANCGEILGVGMVSMPPNSILSLTAMAAPTAFINVPTQLQELRDEGLLNRAWMFRAKLPTYYMYDIQNPPRWPIKLVAIADTSQLKQLEEAIDYTYLSFTNIGAGTRQYYHKLYEGATLKYPVPEWPQFTVYGHPVTIPVTAIYDGLGYDETGTKANISFVVEKLSGHKCYKPFYIFSPAHTSHGEMIHGYTVEGGIPGWPPHLQYDYGGTYHYIWYDLNRYLPPTPFSAYAPSPTGSQTPLIAWQNNRDSLQYELWGKLGAGSWSKKGTAANQVASAMDCQNLTSGVWKIKVRAYSLGGSWQDHSGASSIGDVDDPALYLEVAIA